MGKISAISVIVSLYNYEKYVGECLESLLAQTFTDFEVIVVDDCSTDNSFEVVKSYEEKFGGRLKLTRTEKNSGGGGEPRNIGFSLAGGEYVFFMDADDTLTPTALEEMYALAKRFDADTVYCERYFMSTGCGQEFKKNIHPAYERIQKPPFVNKPTLETTDLAERVKRAINYNYWVTPWLRLVSRNLLVENNIKFDSLIGSNDVNWSFKELFCSKRFLRVPNLCYVRRIHEESVSLRQRTKAQHVHKWMDRTIRSLKYMDDFMAGIEFFRANPVYRYAVVNNFIENDFECIFTECLNESSFTIYNIFREKFGDYLGKDDVLVSCLCAFVNRQHQNLLTVQKKFIELNRSVDQTKKLIQELEKTERQEKAYVLKLEKLVAEAKQKGFLV